MSVATRVGRPRLDPQVLPPATTARFALLIATALTTGAYLYAWLVEQLDVVSGAPAQCAALARSGTGLILPRALVSWYGDCLRWASIQEAGLVGLTLLGFAGLTLGIYLLMPRRLRRGLTPLSEMEVDAATRECAAFVRATAAHMRRPDVEFYIDGARGPSHAFGRLGRYEVALNAETVDKWIRDRSDPTLPTELRHELAHISNRDIDLTYLAIAVWHAFVVAIALPYLIVAVRSPERLLDLSWRLLGLLALVWLARLAVLRTREFYADVRAADSPENEAEVRQYLRQPARSGRWEPLSTHPTRHHRIDAVDLGDPMFRLSVGAAGATGGLVGLAYSPTAFLLDLVLPGRDSLQSWIAGVLFGLLVAGVLAGATWRFALAHTIEGQQWSSTVTAAAAFTAALLLGQVAMPRLPDASTWLDAVMASPVNAGLAALALFGGVQAYLRWTVYCAAVWLPVARHPRRTYHFGLAQSAVVFGLWLGAWFQLIELLRLGGSYLVLVLMLVWVLFNPPLLLALTWACGYPMVAWRSRRLNVDTQPRWWRRGEDVIGRRLPELRPPVPAVYVVTAATVILYSALVLPRYSAIASTVDVLNTELPPPTLAYVELTRLLLEPLLVAAAVVGLVAGVVLGGRRSTGRALSAVGLAALPASIVLMLAFLIHLTTAGAGLRDPLTLVKGLSGIGEVAAKDRPENPALGLMLLALMAALFVVFVTAAGIGSTVRMVLRPWARRRPARTGGRVAAWFAPLVVAALVVGYLGGTNSSIPDDTRIADTVDAAAIEPILARARPGTLSPLASCSAIFQALGGGSELTSSVAVNDMARYLATIAMFALSSTDPTLQVMGEATVESLRGKQLKQAVSDAAVTARYCLASLT